MSNYASASNGSGAQSGPLASLIQQQHPTSTPAADADPDGFTYGKLTQLHPEVECYAAWWAELDLLYKGGHDLAKHIEKFLPKLVDESTARYAERVKCAGYINYLAQVVDYFAGALFQEQLAVTPPLDDKDKATPGEASETPAVYKAFERDADKKSTAFSELLKGLITTALVKRYTWLAVDLPEAPETPPSSLAEEEATGQTRPYAYEVPPECVLDWCEDDDGCLEWAIVRRVVNERKSPKASRDTCVEEFTVWRRVAAGDDTEDSATGARAAAEEKAVTWERYRVSYKTNEKPKPEDRAELVGKGSTSFKRIPLLRLEIKHGLWVGNLIGGVVKEHFQRRSALVSSGNRSLVAIPYVLLGPQAGGFNEPIPAEVSEDQARGEDPVKQFQRKGYLVLAQNDKVGFASPDPGAYDFTAKDLKDLKDELFRVVRQMAASASNTPTALGRSGKSKQMDRDSEAVILGNLGGALRVFAVAVFTLLSEALGEHILWTAHGLETFRTKDREQLLAEALQVDQIPIPSKTFKATYKTDLALSLVENAQPETKELIRQEIRDGVQAEEDMHAIAAMPGDELTEDQAPPNGDAQEDQKAPGVGGPGTPAAPGTQPRGNPLGAPPGAPKAASMKAPGASSSPKDPGGTGSALLAKNMAERAAAGGPPGLQAASAHVPSVAADAHLRASGADAPAFNPGVANTVYALLKDDYPDNAIEWLRDPKLVESIEGPRLVPLAQIDTSNKDEWNAADEDLSGYVEKIAEGKLKPIVLVNEPNDEKFMIVDGHHRELAYEKLGQPAMAYIVHLKTVGDKRVDAMHASQKNENGEAKLTSTQK